MQVTRDTPISSLPIDAATTVDGWQICPFDDGACTVATATGWGGVLVSAFLTKGATVGAVIDLGAASADRAGVIARVAMFLVCGVELAAPVRYPSAEQQTAVVPATGSKPWRCYTRPDGAEQRVVAQGEYDTTAFGAAQAFVDTVGAPAAVWAIDQARARALARL